MDQNLKQRLVGASVIVALAVIFIPMLFDGEPVQGEHQVELRIPDKPKLPPLEKRSFSLDQPVGTQADASPALQHESVPLETAIEPEAVKPIVAARQTDRETIQQKLDSAEQNHSSVTATPESADKKTSQVEKTAAEQPVKKPAEPTQSPGIRPSPSANGVVYRVKIGSFSQRANAEKVRGQLLLEKLTTVIAKDPNRPLFHVYSPAFDNKKSATTFANRVSQASRQRVLNLGQPAVLELSARDSQSIDNQNAKAWVVQVGSFSKLDNARKLRDKLRLQGYTTFVDVVQSANKRLYRVRVGPEVKQEQAENVQDNLKKRLQIQGVIRPHELSDVVD